MYLLLKSHMKSAVETNVPVRGPGSNFHTTQHEEEEHIKHISVLQSVSPALTLCSSLASYQELDLIFTLEYKLVQHTACRTAELSSDSACLNPTMHYSQVS